VLNEFTPARELVFPGGVFVYYAGALGIQTVEQGFLITALEEGDCDYLHSG